MYEVNIHKNNPTVSSWLSDGHDKKNQKYDETVKLKQVSKNEKIMFKKIEKKLAEKRQKSNNGNM